MKRLSLCFLAFSLFGLVPLHSKQAAEEHPLVIIHVTVIDGTGAEAALDQTVIIKGRRITSLGQAGEFPMPADASIVDGTGKFLIPGLWDMHVHTLQGLRPSQYFPLFIANGVTGVREMGSPVGDLGGVSRLRKEIDEGRVQGPRIVAAGPLVDGPNPMFPELSISVSTEREARQAVERKLKANENRRDLAAHIRNWRNHRARGGVDAAGTRLAKWRSQTSRAILFVGGCSLDSIHYRLRNLLLAHAPQSQMK